MTTSEIIEKFLGGLKPILEDTFQVKTCLIEIIQLGTGTNSSVFSSVTWLGINPTPAPDQAEHFTALMKFQMQVATTKAPITHLPNADHLNLTGRAERLRLLGNGPDWVVGVVSTAPAKISEIIATIVLAFLSGIQTLLLQRSETPE